MVREWDISFIWVCSWWWQEKYSKAKWKTTYDTDIHVIFWYLSTEKYLCFVSDRFAIIFTIFSGISIVSTWTSTALPAKFFCRENRGFHLFFEVMQVKPFIRFLRTTTYWVLQKPQFDAVLINRINGLPIAV